MIKKIIFTALFITSIVSYGQNHVFFLHNAFLEENDLQTAHPEYGKVEYDKILSEFRKANCVVISEKRPKGTDVKKYAWKVISQIDSLIQKGIKPKQITVIGTSKGGYIAQYVSTYLKNPNVNFIFIGCFRDSDIEEIPDIIFYGNILTIYEKTDELGVSAMQRKLNSRSNIKNFKEIELNTNLKHGFLYKALPQWIQPCIQWINQNYN